MLKKIAKEKKQQRANEKNENPTRFAKKRAKGKKDHCAKIPKTEFGRRKIFFESVRGGPIYPCVCSRRIKFRKGVEFYDKTLRDKITNNDETILNKTVGSHTIRTTD